MKNAKKLLTLLLVLAMLFALCACGASGDKRSKKDGDKKTTTTTAETAEDNIYSDPEAVAKTYVELLKKADYVSLFDLCAYDGEKAFKANYLTDYDDEDALFADLSDLFCAEIENWENVYTALSDDKQFWLTKDYGDYLIESTIIDNVDLSDSDLDNVTATLLNEHGDHIDESRVKKISKGKNITLDLCVKGSLYENTQTVTLTVVKMDGQWKVASYDGEETSQTSSTNIRVNINNLTSQKLGNVILTFYELNDGSTYSRDISDSNPSAINLPNGEYFLMSYTIYTGDFKVSCEDFVADGRNRTIVITVE